MAELERRTALGELFSRYHDRLRWMVQLRMDRRLRTRVDASDILQEAYIEAAGRFDQYLRDPPMPEYLWLRFLVVQRLLIAHRHHLGVKARSVEREVPIHGHAMPEAPSESLAENLLGQLTSPSRAAMRGELQAKLKTGLDAMEPIDREVLVLRHFEQLSNIESAQVLGLQPRAASARYIRALRRIRDILGPGQVLLD